MNDNSKRVLEHIIREQLEKSSSFRGGEFQPLKPIIDKKPVKLTSSKAKQIAKEIYNSKGYIWNNPDALYKAMVKIKNITEYRDVTQELRKLTKGTGPAAYIRSMIGNRNSGPLYMIKLKIADHLIKTLPKADWWWTVKQLIPWNDIVKRIVSDKTGALERGDLSYMKNASWQSKHPDDKIILKMLTDTSLYAGQYATVAKDLKSKRTHGALQLGQIFGALVPGIGPVLSVGLGLLDANVYRREGDTYTAGLVAAFSLIPGIGGLARKIPGVDKLGVQGMKALARKIAGKQTLNATEQTTANWISKNQSTVSKQLDDYLSKRVNQQGSKLSKTVPPASKNALKPNLKQLAKTSPKLAGTLGFYLYGIPSAYAAGYNVLNPPLTAGDRDTIWTPSVNRITNSALSALKQKLEPKRKTKSKKSKDSSAFRELGKNVAASVIRNKKLESVQPVNEGPPVAGAAGGGLLSDILGYPLASLEMLGYLGIGVAVFVTFAGRNLLRRSSRKGGVVQPYGLPFRQAPFSRLPKLFTVDYYRALRDIKKIRTVKIDGKSINMTKADYNRAVSNLEAKALDEVQKVNKALADGTIGPEQALKEFSYIVPGEGYAKLERYMELWKKGKESAGKPKDYYTSNVTSPGSGFSYNQPSKPKAPSTPPTSAAKPPSRSINSTDDVWNKELQFKYPDVTKSQWDAIVKQLPLNDKLFLMKNPNGISIYRSGGKLKYSISRTR
jgi:hypothetical protein